MSMVAAAVITALGSAVVAGISGGLQSKALKEGQEESRRMYYGDLSLQKQQLARQEKLTRDQMKQNDRQFRQSLSLQKEQLGVQKNEYAHNAFRQQTEKLSTVMDKNEQLKNLFMNRLAGLRN
jgi:hypothetical protein